MKNKERIEIVNRISFVTIIGNVFLSIIKIFVGFIGKSSAIIADGLHSLSDVFSTVVVVIGVKLANKTDDESHPYGHEKIEPVIGKILANILLLTAIYMGYKGIKDILGGEFQVPGRITIYAAILSIFVKEWMYRYTAKGAKQIDSTALMADAWHHRSDALSSVGSLVGVLGARLGYPILDPIAAVVISIFIGKVAIDIYMQSIHDLIDTAADEETVKEIENLILSIKGVLHIDVLKTRRHGNKLFVDVDISVDDALTVCEGHSIAEDVHDAIENQIKKVKHCMVHVNPLSHR